ncbi:MAG TPA: efflux RND transporter periplasmic adaptor subunit [Polyangiaceae bacterium]
MKRVIPFVITLGILAAFAWTLLFLYEKSQAKPVAWKTSKPRVMDVVKKAVAPGSIVPRREVTIKPRVSGVLEKIAVEPGRYVKSGELIAKIRIIPDVVNLNNAEARLKAAQISNENAVSELSRFEKLHAQGLISETELNAQRLNAQLRRQELDTAENNVQLVKVGASKRSGAISNVVYSTVEGMVLEVPVKEGGSVIEANNFNEGTTIASVADMNDLVFLGTVDESEVGKIKVGMPVSITVGALGDQRFQGALEYIAPKGVAKDGTIQFEVRAKLEIQPGTFVRANYSANADIILERKDQVLAISENVVKFDEGKAIVEIEKGPQQFERREVKLGLSDGIDVEVVSGVAPGSTLKVQDGSDQTKPMAGTSRGRR